MLAAVSEEADRQAREEADRQARQQAQRKKRRRPASKLSGRPASKLSGKACEEAERRRPTIVQAKSDPKPRKAPSPKPPTDAPPKRLRLSLAIEELNDGAPAPGGQPIACIPPLGRQVKIDRLMVEDGDVVAKDQPLLVVRTTEVGNERPIVLASPWPSKIHFLIRPGTYSPVTVTSPHSI